MTWCPLHCPSYLWVEPEVDDRVGADRGLGQHAGNGPDVEGEESVWLVAHCLYYAGTGVGKPTQHERTKLKHFLNCILHASKQIQRKKEK